MTSVKLRGHVLVDVVTVRRKPVVTYQSPAQNTAMLYPETSVFTSQDAAVPPLPPSPPSRLSQMHELSPGSTVASRRHMIAPLLPLYHPFGPLALSLPDLDPTAFGLPAPVAVFDDPTRRASHRQRRPAAKVREADELATSTSHASSFVPAISTPESEPREKPSPRRRRGGGPGGKRRRREPEDGDATYPAKRPRHPRSSGVASGWTGTRVFGREEGSPVLSNAHSGASPALEAGRSDVVEEKKPERRTTRSRRVVARRDSTGSEDTASSVSPSVSATVARVVSSGETVDTANDEAASRKAESVEPHV